MGETVLTVDIGGTTLVAGVARREGRGWRIDHRARAATEAYRGGRAVLGTVVTLAREVAARCVADGIRPGALALASAGVIAPESGSVTYASDLLPSWAGIALAREAGAALGLPAVALNDVHAHALGEAHHGAGATGTRVLVVAAGTGLGGAVVTSGRLDAGAAGVAGSLAHLCHPLAAGMRCACGSRTGHIECVASGTGQAAVYNRNLPAETARASDGADVYARACAGDDHAHDALSESGRALGETLASAAALVDPDTIVLTGSATRSGKAWWRGLIAGFRADALPPHADLALLRGTLGGDAPLIGAAIRATDRGKRDTYGGDNPSEKE